MSGLRVLGRAASINVRKVLWTGVELGLDLAREDVDVKADAFRALNPNAMMPVLIDADAAADGAAFSMWESNSICRYLARREGRDDLLPEAPRRRALVEMWMDWQGGELNNSWRYAFMATVRKSALHQDPAQIEASIANWNRHMAMLDRQLARSGGPFVLGDAFTLADVVLGLSAHRWRAAPIPHVELPAVQAWLERLSRRPGFAAHGPAAGP
ncbi:glutathione S-transferase C-terminal domain-containing protein [Mitsuaria sp. GD03876]|uniref:glutathione S-transferase C-terminal domain-containing protein n=1 Tax=Mitsuaria sp. GD03876 TaxID=2975399 RepID=UPI00244B51D4|nr:glutathione S-transferase C-terminal domain-containing protein [Mitsuaria sp. GD03876]MDH0865720.1 glutathione S-transferase C-terminal domain-containing protein [Mitsuaria sp. GD03876]